MSLLTADNYLFYFYTHYNLPIFAVVDITKGIIMVKKFLFVTLMTMLCEATIAEEKTLWTLADCIEYAIEHNITIETSRLSAMSADEDVKESKAQLFPSLSLQTTQQGGYKPFGNSDAHANKATYSADYGLNTSWTLWNGNKNRNNIKLKKTIAEQTHLNIQENINAVKEEILRQYMQTLYVKEAVGVNEEILRISKANTSRGEEMYKIGKISKADLSQLQAQEAADEYNVVDAKAQFEDCLLKMKDLLRLEYDAPFDVADPESVNADVTIAPRSASSVISDALIMRPEMKNAALSIKEAEISEQIAQAGKTPTISLTGGIGSNTMTGTGYSWNKQMKDNFSASAGLTLSIPLIDNRATKTAVNKARIQSEQALLQQEDMRLSLSTDIQGFWTNATANSRRYVSAEASVKSAQDSYNLLSEQFRLGLKNIVELTNAKTALLNAQQNRLESKYTALLYLRLLDIYAGK